MRATRIAPLLLAGLTLFTGGCDLGRPAPLAERVLLVGVDGMDWRVARPLMEAGEMPHLARLVAEGASGELQTLRPTLSPIIWTSVITGMPPDSHGIHGFWRDVEPGEDESGDESDVLDRLEAVGYIAGSAEDETSKRLYRSTDRESPALWSLFSESGRVSDAIAWWVTYPAEAIDGRMISDRYLFNRFELDSEDRGIDYETDAALVHPPSLDEMLRGLKVEADALDPALLETFIAGPLVQDGELTLHDVEDELRIVLAKDASVMRFDERLTSSGRAPFSSVYLQGVDITSHYFWKYRFPDEWHAKFPEDPIPPDEQARYANAVDAAYRLADQQIGRLLEELEPGTAIVLCSDHGFVTGKRSARSQLGAAKTVSGVHGRFAPPGVVVLSGHGVLPGVGLAGAHVYDIAPTILALLGDDVPDRMPGHVLEGALDRGADR